MSDDADYGWVKFYRRTMRSAVWAKPELLKLWSLCLLKANHKMVWVPIEGLRKPAKVLPGQFITGRFQLHKDYYRRHKRTAKSPGTVWRWLQTLRDMENLTLEMNNRFTMVTICNWEKYQSPPDKNGQANEQQMNNRCTTDEQQARTNKNDKNKEEVKPPPAAGTHQAFINWFCERFQSEIGVAYSFQGGKDGAATKSLLGAYTPDQIKDMAAAMFADKQFGRPNASPHILWNQRNKWAASSAPARPSLNPDAVRDLQLSLDIQDGKVAMPDE